jgi:hypothetical protein
VTNTILKTKISIWAEMRLVWECDINFVLAEKVIQLQPPAAEAFSFTISQQQDYFLFRPSKSSSHIRLQTEKIFFASPQVHSSSMESGDSFEQPIGQIYICVNGKIVEEV